MNKLSLALLTLAALPAFAGEKFVCNEYDRGSGALKSRTIVLTQKSAGVLKEGAPAKFLLEGYRGASVSADLVLDGTVTTEDVSFAFSAKSGKATFHIYLDEMNESSLTLNGEEAGSFICR